MLACKKHSTQIALILARLTMALAMLFSTSASADFRIGELQAKFEQGNIMISGTIDLTLSAKVEEAVAKGIPLEFEYEFRLKRQRKLLWSEQLQSWKLKRQIRYHALSGQYFVNDLEESNKQLENFISLQQALRHMGTLNELSLNVVALENIVDENFILETRVSLNIESLPAPLRPVAYTSLDWHLNSGWTTWTVKH